MKLSRPYLGLFPKRNAFFSGAFPKYRFLSWKTQDQNPDQKSFKILCKKNSKYNMSQNVRWYKRFMTKKRNRHKNTPGKKLLLYSDSSDIFQITRYKKLNKCFSTFCKKAENYKLIRLHCKDERGRNRI